MVRSRQTESVTGAKAGRPGPAHWPIPIEAVGVVNHVALAHDVEFFAAAQEDLQVVAIAQAADKLERQRRGCGGSGYHRSGDHRLFGDRGQGLGFGPLLAGEEVARGLFWLHHRYAGTLRNRLCGRRLAGDQGLLAVLAEPVPRRPGQRPGKPQKPHPHHCTLSVHHDLDR
ncbi:hypothetical protein PpSQ1_04415 [Pseudomonas putida]|nr:hypothetical protein PpSQ1_04415 [Pseudomonas putida]